MSTGYLEILNKCENILADIQLLKEASDKAVESCDLQFVEGNIKNAIQELTNIKEYMNAPNTNFITLWEQRQIELQQIKESQEAWIRTEIWKLLLSPSP